MSEQPNILLFLTDDHGAWANGCYGNSEVQTPTLDQLANEGTRFANAFTPSPVCSPARACLLTGQTPSQVGIHDWIQEAEPEYANRDWLAGVPTLAELLRDKGYFTGLSGKWHMGLSHQKPRGYDWYFGLPHWQGDHIEEYTYVLNDQPVKLSGAKTGIITDYALDFLSAAPTDRPFFLQVGYIATHSPYDNQEPELVDLYRDATFRDIPPYIPHPWVKNEGFPTRDPWTQADARKRYMNYYAAVTDMDRNVARIVNQLRDTEQLDNTLVIYTSDHGLSLGQHGFWGKGNSTRPLNMYDISLRIPLIARLPGRIKVGQVLDCCLDHYDTFQTLCDWSGVIPPEHYAYPGQSWRTLAQGDTASDWDERVFGEYGDLRSIRTPDYKLVRRYPTGPDDLFDLRRDSDEINNLAADPAYAEIAVELNAQIDQFYSRYSDPAHSGLRVKELPQHNTSSEAWRDGLREARGLQIY